VLKEDPISAAHRGFPVAERIVSKADAGRRIEQVPVQTASRNTILTALHESDIGIARARNKGSFLSGDVSGGVDLRGAAETIFGGVEVIGLIVFFAIG